MFSIVLLAGTLGETPSSSCGNPGGWLPSVISQKKSRSAPNRPRYDAGAAPGPTDGGTFPASGRVERPRQMPSRSRPVDRLPPRPGVAEIASSPPHRTPRGIAAFTLTGRAADFSGGTIVLVKAGMDHEINATWVFHTAAHKAVDLQRQSRLGEHRPRQEPSGCS